MKGEKGIKRSVHNAYLSGMKYKDISEKYNISINTLRSWVKREGWAAEKKGVNEVKKCAHKKEKMCTQKKEEKKDTKKTKKSTKAEKEIEVEEPAEISELSSKEILFCIYYTQYHNKTKAYQKAYACKYESAHANAWKLWQKKAIQEMVDEMLEQQRNEAKLKAEDIFNKFIDIAFANMHDYVKYGSQEMIITDKGKPLYKENDDGELIALTERKNYVEFQDSDNLDGSIVTEVKQGKGGVSIKLADRVRALDWLSKHFAEFNPEQQARVEKLQAEIKHMKGEDEEIEDLSEMDALIYGKE